MRRRGVPGPGMSPDLSPFIIASSCILLLGNRSVPGGCARVPGLSPDLSPLIIASCPVFYCWGTAVCRGVCRGPWHVSRFVSLHHCLLSCLLLLGNRSVPRGVVPGSLACLRICLPSYSFLVPQTVYCSGSKVCQKTHIVVLGVSGNRQVLSPIIISSCLPSCSRMVVPRVTGNRQVLSTITISCCLPSWRFGSGWWCQRSREIDRSGLPS